MRNKIIDKVLALAAKRGLNQKQFGEVLDVAPANVTNWKKRDLPSHLYAQVASILGISINELLSDGGQDTKAHDVVQTEAIAWPFKSFTATELTKLPATQLDQIERIVGTFLNAPALPDWYTVALNVAKEVDSKTKTKVMTNFMHTVVDRYQAEMLKLQQAHHLPKKTPHEIR